MQRYARLGLVPLRRPRSALDDDALHALGGLRGSYLEVADAAGPMVRAGSGATG